LVPRPPLPPLFPYTTLFRSIGESSSPARAASSALERTHDLRRDPAAVEPALVRMHALLVDEARAHTLWVEREMVLDGREPFDGVDRKSTRLNSSHSQISYAV